MHSGVVVFVCTFARSGPLRSKWVVRRRMGQRPGVPDAVQEAAHQRVIKVGSRSPRNGDSDEPEVATLKSSLQKARVASRSKPIQDQRTVAARFRERTRGAASQLNSTRWRPLL